jgi:chromosome segregation ATPase
VLSWTSIIAPDESAVSVSDPRTELLEEQLMAESARHMRHMINDLSTKTVDFTQAQLHTLASLLNKYDDDQQTLESLYRPHVDHLHALQTDAEGVVRSERDVLEEKSKEIEGLAAKLEYEINGLKAKVEDVEVGVQDFAKGVARVEDRVRELEKEAERAEMRGWRCVVS